MKKFLILLFLVQSILFVGCVSKATVQPGGETPKFNTDTSIGLYQEGQYYFKHKKYDYAQRSFSTLVEAFPEDSLADYAQFMVAEILNNPKNPNKDLVSALDEYRTLIKDYPTTKYADYAQFMIAEILGNPKNPKQDLKSALDEYRKLVKDYPNSKYVAKAQKKIAEIER